MARGWRIRHKLLLGVALFALLLGLGLTGTLMGLWSYYHTVSGVRGRLAELKSAENLKTAVARLVSPSMVLRMGDAPGRMLQPLARAREAVEDYRSQIGEQSELPGRLANDGLLERELAGVIEQDLADLSGALAALMAPRLGVGASVEADDPLKAAQAACEKLERDSRDLRDCIHEDLDHKISASRRNYQFSLWLAVPACAVGLVALAGLLRAFYAWVFNPIRDLQEGVRRIGGGDLDHRLTIESGDEMEDLARAFNAMMERLQSLYSDLNRQVADRSRQLVRSERLASVGYLAAGVAHEINNPLASIAFCAEALEARLRQSAGRLDSPEQREVFERYLNLIQEESFRCKGITEKLLAFSRGGEKTRESADICKLAQSVLDGAQHLPVCRDKRMVLDAPAPVRAWANPEEIKQVVLNLVVNGLESMDPGGTLTVRVSQDGDRAQIEVSDTGVGMDRGTLENIFEPFFTKNRTGSGTGLGLTISHRIIQQHGGEIEATSAGVGQGSVFTVHLPVRAVEGAKPAPDSRSMPRLAA